MQDLELVKFISGIGASGVLILLVWGLMKGWFVTGREHSTLATMVTGLQAQLTAMLAELQRLRDRDDKQQDQIVEQQREIAAQQKEITKLRSDLKDEQALKLAALERVDTLTRDNVALRGRVTELERAVGVNLAGART